ncbi:MAG: beta-propeller domain-containing protein, partial [Lachnospiraceae bacterium]|nr:beta-propeller domain-containing protein [Lachnospiraceae bacterium]
VYNIADRTAPVLAAQHSQDGRVVSSREKDGWLYVISEKDSMTFGIWELDQAPVRINTIPGPDGAAQDGGENEDEPVSGLSETEMKCLPKADGELLPANRIYFSEEYGSSAYTIVTSIRLSEPDCFADSLSFMTGSSGCYVSAEAVYLTAYDWMPNFELESVWELDEEGDTEAAKKEKTETGEVSKEEIPETKNTGENEGTQNSTEAGGNSGEDSSDRTRIIKLGYADGKLSVLAQGSVKGSIDSQFSMDERNGYLRLVTTVEHYGPAEDEEYSWREYKGRTNSLYVLDSELRTAGALENLAEDESIYSARFLGNIAYFVTYRNTDPLFSVDLTDPEHPRLLGALKLPGFSDYLQPYGDGMLLGIGYDTDEAGNATGCIKLTMFDITDPVNVVEKHTLILHEFSGSEACWNHKSVLASRERDLIGLPAEGYDYFDDGERYGSIYTKAYLVYGYDGERGFYPRLQKEYVNRWTGGRYTIEPVFEESAPDAGGKAGETGISQGGLSGGQSDETDMDRDSWYALRMRGIYIGDYLYVVNTEMEVISCRTEQERLEEYGRLNLRLR